MKFRLQSTGLKYEACLVKDKIVMFCEDDVMYVSSDEFLQMINAGEVIGYRDKKNIAKKTSFEKLIHEVFDYWVICTDRGSKTKLSVDRVKMIKDRLKEGYSVETLKSAIRGLLKDSWFVEKGFDELKYCLESGQKVEKFSNIDSSVKEIF